MRAGCFSEQALGELLPDAFGTRESASPESTMCAHQLHRLRDDREAEARGEARDAQDAHRILGERVADMTQHAGLQIVLAAERIDQRAVLGLAPWR